MNAQQALEALFAQDDKDVSSLPGVSGKVDIALSSEDGLSNHRDGECEGLSAKERASDRVTECRLWSHLPTFIALIARGCIFWKLDSRSFQVWVVKPTYAGV